LLDFPDPATSSSDRQSTTVAPQALLMLNSDLVMQAAADFADRLLREPGADEQRLQRMYELAYGRPASDDEIAAAVKFVADAELALATSQSNADERRRQAWSILCQTILASSELIYVR
jgi:hypothetical protein